MLNRTSRLMIAGLFCAAAGFVPGYATEAAADGHEQDPQAQSQSIPLENFCVKGMDLKTPNVNNLQLQIMNAYMTTQKAWDDIAKEIHSNMSFGFDLNSNKIKSAMRLSDAADHIMKGESEAPDDPFAQTFPEMCVLPQINGKSSVNPFLAERLKNTIVIDYEPWLNAESDDDRANLVRDGIIKKAEKMGWNL